MDDETRDTRSADEIRREIERTRADMDETVDALGERLSPGRIVDELWARLRQGDGLSGVGDMVREHPIPLALMGLGIGWLAVERATGDGGRERERVGPGTWARAEGRRGPYGPDAVRHDDPDWVHTGAATKLKARLSEVGERLSDVKERVSDAVHEKTGSAAESARDLEARAAAVGHDVRERATGKAHELRDRTADTAHRVADGARERARGARQGLRELMEENPMVIGAIAFGVGLASGLAAPTTPAEDRLMGRASDTLKGEAKRVAEHTADGAKHVAHDAAEAARDELERVRTDEEGTARSALDALSDAAKRVAYAARDAARERAEEEKLTGEGLSEEARSAAARTREAAKRPGARRKRDGRVGKGSP
jgi:hypothetical protein